MTTQPEYTHAPCFGPVARRTGLPQIRRWISTVAFLALGVSGLMAKSLIFEGFIDLAPTSFRSPATHVMRFSPGERIEVALADPRHYLILRPLERVRILGFLASEVTMNGVPVVQVEEVWPADWAQPLHVLSPVTVANWNGAGSSFYPSLRNEPLPNPPFVAPTGGPVDSDGDGVPDYLDDFPNDPAETKDTDFDGVGNNADKDDDNDLMSDVYELANGLNPLVKDAGGDLDKDGMTNLDESIAGTQSNDPKSLLRFESIKWLGKSEILLTWQSVAGKRYRLLGADWPERTYVEMLTDLRADGPTLSQSIDTTQTRYHFFIVEVMPP